MKTCSLTVQVPFYTPFRGLFEFFIVNLDVSDLAVCRDLLVDLFAGFMNDLDKGLPGYFVLSHGFRVGVD